MPSRAVPCARTGQAAWLSSKLINLILSYFRDIFFVNTDAEAVRERTEGGGGWDNIRTHLTLTDLRPRTARWLEGHADKETH